MKGACCWAWPIRVHEIENQRVLLLDIWMITLFRTGWLRKEKQVFPGVISNLHTRHELTVLVIEYLLVLPKKPPFIGCQCYLFFIHHKGRRFFFGIDILKHQCCELCGCPRSGLVTVGINDETSFAGVGGVEVVIKPLWSAAVRRVVNLNERAFPNY